MLDVQAKLRLTSSIKKVPTLEHVKGDGDEASNIFANSIKLYSTLDMPVTLRTQQLMGRRRTLVVDQRKQMVR
jgi:hypothetical protein